MMIAYLADRREPVSRASLAGLLWSDHPEQHARTNLRVALTRTRQFVPQVRADRTSVELVGSVRFDLHEIEGGDVDDAMSGYRGDALAGIEVEGAELFDEWLMARREQHRTLTMRSLANGCRDAATGGHWSDVEGFARKMIEIEPWNEVAQRHLIIALATTEGRSSALAVFEQCVDVLQAEFGVAPDDETTELAAAIRAGTFAPTPSVPVGPAAADRPIAWRLLGDVAVEIAGVAVDVGGKHRRSVMADLALNAPQRCSFEHLSAAVWGDDPPATARQSIQRLIREVADLDPQLADRIERVPDGYRLNALVSEVDAQDVRARIAAAQSDLRLGDLEAGASVLREAISRWDGASLGGVTRLGPLGSARESLEELRLGAIEDLVEAELALGRHREIASEAEAFASEHPTRDRSWANLILARARTGRRAEAVEAYRQFCSNLEHEGLAPSASIVALYRQILSEAPAVHPDDDLDTPHQGWTVPTTTFSVSLPAAFERSALLSLVGRDEEMRRLLRVFDATSNKGPSTVFVSGEPGIGKTRVASELAKAAHESGAVVLYGRCDDTPGMPYRPWREALAHLADHIPPHIARHHLERFGPSLRLLMPSLAGGSANDAVAAVDESQRELLFRAIDGLLHDVAKRRRLLIVIDDMQWAHSSTLDLLRHLARNASESMMLLGLHRSTEIPEGHQLHGVVAALEEADLVEVIPLDEIDEDARCDLVRDIVDEDQRELAPQIAARIASETGGNPFFFTEVVRSLRETDSIAAMLGSEVAAAIPPTVQRVVAQRVARLGDSAAHTLRTASVFGREFDLDVLALVMKCGEDDALTDLEAALSAGLVTDAPSGRDRFAFAHDLLHHTLSAQLSQSRRCRVHERIADAIDELHGPDLGDLVPVVATHLLAADASDRRAETGRRCREAGHHAGTQLATDEAIGWFERALEHVEATERAAVLVELGTQQRNAADPEHRSTLIEAGRRALAMGDAETLTAATLANSRGMNAHVWELDHERIAMLRATLDAIGPEPSANRADLLASLANEQWDAEHRDEAERFYREAMSIARAAGVTGTLARVLVRVSRARNFRLGRAEMASVSAELNSLVPCLGLEDPLLLANCLTTVLNTSIRLGLANETRTAINAICRTADELPLPMFTLPAHLARCLDAGLRGDIGAYEAASTATYHHATEIGDEEAGFIFEGQMFYTAYLRGDLAPILDFSTRVMHERPDVPLYRAVCTLIHVEAGQHDAARSLLDTDVRSGFEPSVDMFQIQALVAWADAASTLRHAGACEQLFDALIGLSSEMSGHLVQVGEPIDVALGRLASALGRYDEAERHFDLAAEIAAGYEARWMSAAVEVSRAEMLLRRDRHSDSSDALEIARAVAEQARAHGYRAIAARASTLLEAG